MFVMTAKIAVSAALLAFLFSKIDASRLWASARKASLLWLVAALAVQALNLIASTWRWQVLLHAQDVRLKKRTLLGSYLVATFFNNFLPSNVGGDVIRIRDTAVATQSKTLATTVVLVDRALGLMALVLISAVGATAAASLYGSGASRFGLPGCGRFLSPVRRFRPPSCTRLKDLDGCCNRSQSFIRNGWGLVSTS